MFQYIVTDSYAIAPLYQDIMAMFPYIEWETQGDQIIGRWEHLDHEVMVHISNFISGWISCWKRHMH